MVKNDREKIELGIIGYGSMGSMFVRGFISSGRICERDIIISTRNKNTLQSIIEIWPGIKIAVNNSEVSERAKHIFICVKPHQVIDVLNEIKGSINNQTHIISTNSFVAIANIEKLLKCKVTKVSPSLTSEVGEGIALVCHGNSVLEDDMNYIENLLNGIGRVVSIKESDFEIADKLTSCGPGFLATIVDEFIQSGTDDNGGIPREVAELLVLQTLLGTAKFLAEGEMTIKDLISRVATRGGITEEGILVLREQLPNVFNRMFDCSISKSRHISELVNNEFC